MDRKVAHKRTLWRLDLAEQLSLVADFYRQHLWAGTNWLVLVIVLLKLLFQPFSTIEGDLEHFTLQRSCGVYLLH